MLKDIIPSLRHNVEILSAVSVMVIEIVDASLIRVVGTGALSAREGEPMHPLGAVSPQADQSRSSQIMDGSGHSCDEHGEGRLAICAPIILADEVVGYIRMAGLTSEHRKKVLQQRDVYRGFAEQFAQSVCRTLSDTMQRDKNIRMLDMLLEVTENDAHAILVCDAQNRISYANEAAMKQFSLPEGYPEMAVTVRQTGKRVGELEEFELCIDGAAHFSLGRYMHLEGTDASFSRIGSSSFIFPTRTTASPVCLLQAWMAPRQISSGALSPPMASTASSIISHLDPPHHSEDPPE